MFTRGSIAGFLGFLTIGLPLLHAESPEDVPFPDALGVTFVDAKTGKPIPQLPWSLRAGRADRPAASFADPSQLSIALREHVEKEGVAGPDGKCTIELDGFQPDSINIRWEKEGYTSCVWVWRRATMNEAPRANLAADVEIRIPPTVEIGGFVVDEEGAPIPDVRVDVRYFPHRSGTRPPGELAMNSSEPFVTDERGRFASNNLPYDAADEHISLLLVHPAYTQNFFKQSVDRLTLAELQEQKRRFVLPKDDQPARQSTVRGRVVDEKGKPIAGAGVFAQRQPAESGCAVPLKIMTDADGRFELTDVRPSETLQQLSTDPVPTAVVVEASCAGFAPQQGIVSLEGEAATVTLTMLPVLPFHGRVVDKSGKPIHGVFVLFTAVGAGALTGYRCETDEAGKFEWADAPRVPIDVSIQGGDGILRKKVAGLLPRAEPHEIVALPATQFRGSVLDASTGKPMDRFEAVLGYDLPDRTGTFWETNGGDYRDGTFEKTTMYDCLAVYVRVKAEGYRSITSAAYVPRGEDISDTFRLEPAPRMEWEIAVAPSDLTDMKVLAFVCEGNEPAVLLQNGRLDPRMGGARQPRVIALRGNRFSYPLENESAMILITSEKGYAHFRPTATSESLVSLQPWARIYGKVTNITNAVQLHVTTTTMVQGIRVTNECLIRTESDGSFSLDGLFAGRCVIGRVLDMGQAVEYAYDFQTTLAPGETQAIEFAMRDHSE
ncbi:MAG: carboxypeptidase regulatory-like domain-containing protein [Phycisphaerae bacterium]